MNFKNSKYDPRTIFSMKSKIRFLNKKIEKLENNILLKEFKRKNIQKENEIYKLKKINQNQEDRIRILEDELDMYKDLVNSHLKINVTNSASNPMEVEVDI